VGSDVEHLDLFDLEFELFDLLFEAELVGGFDALVVALAEIVDFLEPEAAVGELREGGLEAENVLVLH